MNCGQVERVVMAPVEDARPRAEEAAQALEHARACPACRIWLPLLEWFAEAPEARAAREEPGPHYWEAFDASLAARLRRERRYFWIRAAAAAAALVLVMVAGLWLGRWGMPQWPLGSSGTGELGGAVVHTELEASEAEPLLDTIELWLAMEPGEFGVVPDLEALDEEEAAALLQWLEQETARLEREGQG